MKLDKREIDRHIEKVYYAPEGDKMNILDEEFEIVYVSGDPCVFVEDIEHLFLELKELRALRDEFVNVCDALLDFVIPTEHRVIEAAEKVMEQARKLKLQEESEND